MGASNTVTTGLQTTAAKFVAQVIENVPAPRMLYRPPCTRAAPSTSNIQQRVGLHHRDLLSQRSRFMLVSTLGAWTVTSAMNTSPATVDPRLFRRFVVLSLVGGAIAAVVLPPLIAAVWPGLPANFPIGARASLAMGWMSLVLFGIAWMNLRRVWTGGAPIDFNTPPGVLVWLRDAALGIAMLELGYAIGTTVFK